LFALQHVLTPEFSAEGFVLLKLIQSYLELDMFMSLTVQTDDTLAAGLEELLNFKKLLHVRFKFYYCVFKADKTNSWPNLLKEYEDINPDKSWGFSKAHTHQHVFRDILQKGVTRNYNTKPSEKANGPLKKYYARTNFKNVAPQVMSLLPNSYIFSMLHLKRVRILE